MQKNVKHIIFCDIDGTIYDDRKIIDPKAVEVVRKAQEKGIEFVICTGNAMFRQVRIVQKAFNANYAIVSNGSGIYDFRQEKYIYEKRISKRRFGILADIGKLYGVKFNFWDDEAVYFSEGSSKNLIRMVEHIMGGDSREFTGEMRGGAFKLEYYDDANKIASIARDLKIHDFEFAWMEPNHIEVTSAGVSKGTAANHLCQLLNANINDCMAIGDSANDISVLKLAGYSYAMANYKTENVIEVVKYHTSHVNQHGLAEAVEDYLYRIKA